MNAIVKTTTRNRRLWSAADKAQLVEESSRPGKTVSGVARKAGIAPSQLFTWRRQLAEGGQAAVTVAAIENLVCASSIPGLKRRVHELERLVGKKTMEVELLKEALEAAGAKGPNLRSMPPKEDAPG